MAWYNVGVGALVELRKEDGRAIEEEEKEVQRARRLRDEEE